ncbi:Trp biosynthesis-associated membrane protein [Cellulomonas chengniuliangii]|uniref:Trp biosynthesis-associated membrane protein n=1 Tax=Cellulomonas chengniuliangii TaxID=2968084 RepID=A0ABY5L1B9_9CELL|nr:Trp biosynthesis-associated membrane protein [Cellulomonas chengniuliangii]MCC2308185.1 Trp biosynthesis-associated membrane protein [Cellulomonas chengniuliangii]MCC2317192.1 Trp biosynthesis-associated membrane protein [Cellulomonas chengniuliangii]UUI76577.1 Trp biosynthesis-associated membrane protein [Cellulomonas chengniuliangii]
MSDLADVAGQPTSPGAGARRRGRGPAAALLVLLAALTAGAALPVWLRSTGTSALHGEVAVEVTGTQAAPGVVAAALVLLAATAAVGLVGRAGRWVVVVVVAAAGAVVVASAAGAVADAAGAAEAAVAELTGVGVLTAPVEITVWPWAALLAGCADVVAAVVLAALSRSWPQPSRRHASPAVAAAVPQQGAPVDDQAAWDSLTRGDDPT